MIAEAKDVTPRGFLQRHKYVSPFKKALAIAEVDRLRKQVKANEKRIVELNAESNPDLVKIGAWRSAWETNTRWLAEAENKLAKL